MATDTSYPRQGVDPFTIPGDHWGVPSPAYSPASQPTATPPPQVPITVPATPTAPAPLDPGQLASALYDKEIPIGFSTRSQWGGRIIEGPVFDVIGSERVVSFIAGYYIPINFWDATRTVSELYFRGQLAWTLDGGALMSGLNVNRVTPADRAQTVRFATGTLAQTPDDWSISRYGAQAVAYVPLVTATFENIRTAQFGNIVPFTSVTVDDTAYGTPGDLVAWADAIEALARHDGREADEFETVDVSGGLNALILGSKTTFTDFLAAMRKHKPQWTIRTTEKLSLVEKGLFSLDLTLDQAKLVSHGAQPIIVHSSDAFEKPREKICHYLDIDRDYEPSNVRVAEDIDPVVATDSFDTDSYDIPVVSTADIVMTETAFAYYTGEVARQQSEFSGMAHYLALEPGDCYKWITAAGRTFYHRVNEIVRRADFTVDVKGEGFLTCAIETDYDGSPGGTWNLADKSPSISLSNGDLTATASGGVGNRAVRSTTWRTITKVYFEVLYTKINGGSQIGCGLALATADLALYAGNAKDGIAVNCLGGGAIWKDQASTGISLGTAVDGQRHCIAVDLSVMRFWARLDSGNWNGSGTADPAANVGGIDIAPVFAGQHVYAAQPMSVFNDSATANFGATTFAHAMPSGFQAWDLLH
jgi:Putative phage tail protein